VLKTFDPSSHLRECDMVKKPHRISKAADIEKQLVGHRIPAEHLHNLWFPVGSYDYSGTDEGATSSWQHIFLPGKNCNPTTLLDASGVSSTLADGKRTFMLSEVVCFDPVYVLAEPVNVVATPRAEKPFFLTTTHVLVPIQLPNTIQNTDLQITVFAWDANGRAAPNVVFDWRCRAVSVGIVL
jgi:hypothetical protein